ncbi:saccharopine dehydrogenase (NADP+, L-glutamate-forming) [Chytriomyces hyalinus]|nr:saccharopine dehydrogenase (NADP+, L-glutamate-forming) [Chytriomyces hyalinus]
MPSVLLLGSGFVADPCLSYLLKRDNNKVTVAARRVANVESLIAGRPNASAIALDVNDDAALEAAVAKHDLVISLIPYTHHARVIKAAIKHRKHVVTTSYISPAMMELDQAAKDAGITVMNEIGVDPGIDHLYAIKTIDEVHALGGKITSFTSYCGGLPAPECSNNPLGYKFSWSSRGVLLALRNNAKCLVDGKVLDIAGPELMNSAKNIPIYPAFAFEGYPNRDSTPYNERYHIPEAKTVIRGTLRYAGFPNFIKALVKLGFLDDKEVPQLAATAAPVQWRHLLSQAAGVKFTSVDDLEAAVKKTANISGDDGERIIFGMKWLGMFSETNVHLRGTMLDTLCATLEDKMMYAPGERDMVMLQHRFGVEFPNGKKEIRTSTGLWFGVPNGDSAMATTVGVPCGIATQLILDGKISRKGVIAPMDKEINNPIMEALEKEGIFMVDEIIA